MKKVFITGLMCLIAFYSYGTSTNAIKTNEESIEKMEITSLSFNETTSINTQVANENLAMVNYYRDCTVRLRLRFIDSGGRTTSIDGEITFTGVSCAELIKQLGK